MSEVLSPRAGKQFNPIESLLWEFGRRLPLEIHNPSSMMHTAQHLQSGSVLLTHNHPGTYDPLEALRIAIRIAEIAGYQDDGMQTVTSIDYLASLKFFDGRMGPLLGQFPGYLQRKYPEYNLQILRVAQSYDTTGMQLLGMHIVQMKNQQNISSDELTKLGHEEAGKINFRTLRTVFEHLSHSGAIIMLAPEGTRSPDGTLQRPDGIISRILAHLPDNTKILPVSIAGTEKIHRKGQSGFHINPFARVHAVLGNLITAPELAAQTQPLNTVNLADALMMITAMNLPQQYWGTYEENMKKVLQIE